MNMKKKLLLSMILLALCLIQASANYYYKIRLYKDNGEVGNWTSYIEVKYENNQYVNGLLDLINGKTVKDEENNPYTLPKKANKEVDLDRIWGIVFANEKGRNKGNGLNILEGDEYKVAWPKIRTRIKYLELREYKLDTYTGDSYFMDMHNVEELELPKGGMNVGSGDDFIRYFANADKLKKITICRVEDDKKFDITDDGAKDIPLLNRVGKFMFSNCYSLSTKYINRLMKNVSEIEDNAFYADDGNRGKFSDETSNTIIEIPSTVTKIGAQAFYNRVKVTGLNIHGNGGLEIGFEAFRGCDKLANITLDNITSNYSAITLHH